LHKIVIQGGQRLTGTVQVSGAKNAVLPLLAASLLPARGESRLHNVPDLSDVRYYSALLQALGVHTEEIASGSLRLDAKSVDATEAPAEYVRKMRASFLVLGPMLARFGKAEVALPGGCSIGERPIDLHIMGFRALGAHVEETPEKITATVPAGKRLRGAQIDLSFASVGATQNLMMAATLAEGTTVINNAAQEPEMVDLQTYLNAMGAQVSGAGTSTIRIQGVSELTGAEHTVIPDRIEAGTFLVAGAMTRGDLYVQGAVSHHLQALLEKLQEAGVTLTTDRQGIRVKATRPLRPLDVKTWVYPGFPTDLQAQLMTLMTVANGTSYVTESVFENRFMHVPELCRMGADIRVEGRTSVITGVKRLHGASVTSTDLRAGASLLIAGMAAEGLTEVHGLHHIDRGYVNIVERLQNVGAELRRFKVETTTEEAERAFFQTIS